MSKNDDTGYTTGEMEAIPGAQGRRAGKARLEAEDAPKGTRRPEPRAARGGTGRSATMDRSTEDYSILADDQIWDSGADFTGETLEITVIELGLPLMAALDGADYDEEEGVYSWGPGKTPPEIAIGFRALKADGTYRMVKYYSCSVTSITAEYATKGQNTEGTPYVLTLAAKTRIQDGQLYAMSDGTAAGDSTWLDTIDSLPTA